jgi:hypothetical protein
MTFCLQGMDHLDRIKAHRAFRSSVVFLIVMCITMKP